MGYDFFRVFIYIHTYTYYSSHVLFIAFAFAFAFGKKGILQSTAEYEYESVKRIQRLCFLSNAGFPPKYTYERIETTAHMAATTIFMLPYPILSRNAPAKRGPKVRPALKT